MPKQNSKIILSFILALAFPSLVWGAPSIAEVSGNISDGESITISGSGFGINGPNVVLFDSFEKGNIGNNISTVNNSADIGNWDTLGAVGSTYTTEYAFGGQKAMKIDWSVSWGSGPELLFDGVQNSDLIMSWWQYMPTSRDVPGTNNVDGPNWKWFWIVDIDDVYGSDYVGTTLTNTLPTGNHFSFGTNYDSAAPTRYESGYNQTTMAKGTWLRNTITAKNATSGAYVWIQEILKDISNTVVVNGTNTVTAHSDDPWNFFHLPGYGREDNNAVLYIDDVYVATGDGARARVEIGNASTYNASTNLALLTPTAWSASSINATVRSGSFTGGSNAYLYVVDSTGAVNATGYPITIGSGSGEDTTAPNAPQGLNIL